MFNLDSQSNLSNFEHNDVNTMCNNFSRTLNTVADKHAPLKSKMCIDKPVPYMNKTLKQAIKKIGKSGKDIASKQT